MLDRLGDVNRRIAAAVHRAGRRAGDIELVGVTKTVGVDMVAEFLKCGQVQVGENRVQEMLGKKAELEAMGFYPRWHMIGRLQTNKVKDVVGKVVLIHSLDSERLALEISRQSEGFCQGVLLQVNIGEEASKGGVDPREALDFARMVHDTPNIGLRGLMAVPPAVEDKEESRYFFRKMHQLFIDIRASIDDNRINTLSMGMSDDFEVAIEEGSTMIRLGSIIFGERNQ